MNGLKAMQGRISVRDVARQAGVSVGTVSRVINRKPVSPKMVAIVNRTMREMGYTPNAVAQSMRTKTTYTAALVVNDISNPLFSSIAKGAEQILREKNYSLFIANTENNPQREQLIIQSLVHRRVDGLIIAVADERSANTKSILRSVDFPVTLLDREVDLSMDAVCDEHALGMKTAVRYLFDLGHKDIALITGGDNVRPGRERAAGFREAFRERGLAVMDSWLRQGRLDALFGFAQAREILSSQPRPTALIAGGNQILSGVLRAIRQLQLRIPNDLSLVSCDDIDLTVLMNPPITVIARDIERIGRVAAELLLRRMSKTIETDAIKLSIPTELIVRDSCRPIATGPPPDSGSTNR